MAKADKDALSAMDSLKKCECFAYRWRLIWSDDAHVEMERSKSVCALEKFHSTDDMIHIHAEGVG